ncbi:MAG: hypothetical protein DDT22_00298 [candidate division WS2 bacterium]|nr:hypothetical protein [Candidatus Lithacetigena glycinireducens]
MGLPQGFALRNDFRGMTGVGKDEAAAVAFGNLTETKKR